jgi:hypothetical protein
MNLEKNQFGTEAAVADTALYLIIYSPRRSMEIITLIY